MSLVLDSSLALNWFFEDEEIPEGEAVLTQVTNSGAIVPSLWKLEMANAFLTAIRRKRIDIAYRDQALARLANLRIEVDPDTDARAWTATIQLADRFRLTAYDAAYLELAQRRNLPLATRDRELRVAGAAVRLTLLG